MYALKEQIFNQHVTRLSSLWQANLPNYKIKRGRKKTKERFGLHTSLYLIFYHLMTILTDI